MPHINGDYILDNAPCGFISFNADGTIVQMNLILLKWLNSTKEDIVLKKKFQDIINKGSQLYFQMYVFPLLNMQGYINEISFSLVSSQNINISCLLNASVIRNDDGTIHLINASLFNITDRKKYEVEILKAKNQAEQEKERFEFLANTLPNIVWTALPSGEINFQNDRYVEYFGLKRYQTTLSFYRNVLFPEDFRNTLGLWMKARAEEKDFECELRLKTMHGTFNWFSVQVISCRDKEGKLLMWLGSCTDIHVGKEKQLNVLKKLHQELANTSSIIEHNAQVLKEVAFAQSHLVRSPVSKILGLISLLKDREVDEETRFIISLLTQSTEQLDSIISEIVEKSHTAPEKDHVY